MKICHDIPAWQAYRSGLPEGSVGFIPTMGALHAGHLSLVGRARAENDHTVVSIFVNPTQFDEAADLAAYPADLDHDLSLLEQQGVDAVLIPDHEAMYSDDYRYRVSESELSARFCGAHREGHFDGVLTVVMRLLNLVRPERAYFGEKDYQQLELVRGMVKAFFMPVEIVGCATVRDRDGLALSSRNRNLGQQDRALAPLLYQALCKSPDPRLARQELESQGFEVDYVEDIGQRRLAAASLGGIRLIDNVSLEQANES
jgi:pantoate--beta-alanine ligase